MRRLLLAATEAAAAVRRGTPDEHCCVYIEAVLRRAYGAAVDAVPRARWRIIRDDPAAPGVGPWEPVLAAATAEIATAVWLPGAELEPHPMTGRWHVVQSWRGTPLAPGVRGHTWLWYALTATHGILVDSSEETGPRCPAPGPQSWADRVRPYVGGVAIAVLRPIAS